MTTSLATFVEGDKPRSQVGYRFIPDFSNWKDHDAFEVAFKRLLSDLKAEADRDAAGTGGDAK